MVLGHKLHPNEESLGVEQNLHGWHLAASDICIHVQFNHSIKARIGHCTDADRPRRGEGVYIGGKYTASK